MRFRRPAPVVIAAFLVAGACTSVDSGSPAGGSSSAGSGSGAGSGGGVIQGCNDPVTLPEPDSDRPRYELSVEVRPDDEVVSGRLSVVFIPDLRTDRLVFRLWPNGPRQAREGTSLNVGAVRVDGRTAPSSRTDPTTLEVPIEGGLDPGDAVRAAMSWRLELPGPVFDRISSDGDSIRLGSFFPLLAWNPGEGWMTDPPTRSLAETSASPTADFDVSVTVPQELEVIASGSPVGADMWRARAMRDFAMTVGSFDVAQGTALAPDPVDVTVAVDDDVDESPETYRDDAVRALGELAESYGPYPWPTFNLVITPHLAHAGIEYPTFVMQGAETSGLVTDHEVAHQWFYALVGSNPARAPWLDEGLTSYAQARIDDQIGFFADQEIPEPVAGHLGAGMAFWDEHQADYFLGAYAQGVAALASLGDDEAVDCGLRRYVAANAYGIADEADLLRALRPSLPGAAARLADFGVTP